MSAEGTSTESSYVLERAWVDGEVRSEVAVTIADGRFTRVGGAPDPGAVRLSGLTVPGLANAHSHASHRALRAPGPAGRTGGARLAALVERLDPDSYRELAAAVFAEMVAAGITCVGEFHDLHHQAGGTPYDEPNAMGLALVEAARSAGLRIALLDSCHLTGGFGAPLTGVGLRFSDGTAESWQERADELTADVDGDVVVGAAIQSVRAVPLDDMRLVAEWADRFETPLHVHLSGERAENDACLEVFGRTPTELLAEAGVLTDRTTVVHATHVTEVDLVRLAAGGCGACRCPTTERALGESGRPATDLAAAGIGLTLGTGSNLVVDVFEEARGLYLPGAGPLVAATAAGHAALGFRDAGRLAVGCRGDLVTLAVPAERAADATGARAATAADVVHVVAGGTVRHRAEDAPEVRARLDRVLRRLWR